MQSGEKEFLQDSKKRDSMLIEVKSSEGLQKVPNPQVKLLKKGPDVNELNVSPQRRYIALRDTLYEIDVTSGSRKQHPRPLRSEALIDVYQLPHSSSLMFVGGLNKKLYISDVSDPTKIKKSFDLSDDPVSLARMPEVNWSGDKMIYINTRKGIVAINPYAEELLVFSNFLGFLNGIIITHSWVIPGDEPRFIIALALDFEVMLYFYNKVKNQDFSRKVTFSGSPLVTAGKVLNREWFCLAVYSISSRINELQLWHIPTARLYERFLVGCGPENFTLDIVTLNNNYLSCLTKKQNFVVDISQFAYNQIIKKIKDGFPSGVDIPNDLVQLVWTAI